MSIAPPTNKLFRPKRKEVVALVVAAIGAIGLVAAALLGGREVINVILPGQGETSLIPPTPTTSSAPPPPPTTTAPAPEPTPTVVMRRSTGDNPLTLTGRYAADLDSMDPAWDVEQVTAPYMDIRFAWGQLYGGAADLAIVSGAANYETCQNATGYKKFLAKDEVTSGTNLCVRTSEKRLAFVTITKVIPRHSPTQIQLDVTVWDPQFEE